VVRDGSSHNRWYTLELVLADVDPGPSSDLPPAVSVVASHDNPDRGGVLWVANQRQGGSLVMRANWQGKSLFRRYQTEVEPQLPSALQTPLARWLLVLALHWAVLFLAYTLVVAERPEDWDRRAVA